MLRIHIYKRTIRGPSLVLFVLLFRSLKEFWLPSLKNECLQHVFTPGWSLSLCVEHSIVRPFAAESHPTVVSGKSMCSFENLDWLCAAGVSRSWGLLQGSRAGQPSLCTIENWDWFLSSSSQHEPELPGGRWKIHLRKILTGNGIK